MFVASEEATAGSVIAKHDRISPASSGLSHLSFCSGVPYRVSTSILPVSGAEQLKASGAITLPPIISQSEIGRASCRERHPNRRDRRGGQRIAQDDEYG